MTRQVYTILILLTVIKYMYNKFSRKILFNSKKFLSNKDRVHRVKVFPIPQPCTKKQNIELFQDAKVIQKKKVERSRGKNLHLVKILQNFQLVARWMSLNERLEHFSSSLRDRSYTIIF